MSSPSPPAGRLARAVLVALAVSACAPDPGAPLARVDRAFLSLAATDAPPAGPAAAWQAETLSDYWGLRRRLRTLRGWYRIEFEAPEPVPVDWAASFSGAWAEIAPWLNGEPLSFVPAAGADAVRTERIAFPREALRPGRNELLVRVDMRPDQIGFFDPVAIGPIARVRAADAGIQRAARTLSHALAWLALASAGLLALLARWDENRSAAWLAAGGLAWSLPALEPLAPLAGWGGGFVGSLLAHAALPCLAIAYHRALGLERRGLERLLVAVTLGGAAARLAVPPVYVPVVDNLWWLFLFGIGFYLLALARLAVRRGTLEDGAMLLGAVALGLLAASHDFASLLAGRLLAGVLMLPLLPGIVGVAAAITLVTSLGMRMSELRRLNVALEERVEEKRRELAASYARTAELERARAVADERDRLMREMHDGAGGQLVSALSMVESGAFERGAVLEALRDALADLRFSIDSLDPAEPDLLSLLGAARARLEPRLEPSGLRFAWEVRDVGAPAGFGPGSAVEVLRIFQEAVVNALRHARARVVAVRTREEDDPAGPGWIVIEIADDGQGFAAEAVGPGAGRGLGNMRRRAASLGGELRVATGPGGTTVALRLPRAKPPPASPTRRA